MHYPKIPHLQVRSNCLIYYELPSFTPGRKLTPISAPAYSGTVSAGASKRIKKAIDILIQKSPARMTYNSVSGKWFPFTLNFVTLTIACKRNIPADEAYKVLMKPFLRKLRKGGDFSYMWKAELQKRGQLHYHLATNTFLPWSEIRNGWNNLQRNAGYLQSYGLKHKHYDANSTDVHSIYKVGNLSAYLAKYLSKNESDKIKGKVWDCSRDLKQNRFSFIVGAEASDRIDKGIFKGKIEQINLDHCVIFKCSDPLAYLPIADYKDYILWQS